MDNNIVEYLDTNMDVDNLMSNINKLPTSRPNFADPVQPPNYVRPSPQPNHHLSQEQIMMMQNITDARQIPSATIMTTQSAPGNEPQSAVFYNGIQYPLILFKPEVLQQMQQMQMQRQQPIPQAPIPQLPIPQVPIPQVPMPVLEPPIATNNQSVIDLTVKQDSENLTSHSRGVMCLSEEVKEVSLITSLYKDYGKSILVLCLLLLMYTGFDKMIIEKVAFLDNVMIMVACKAIVLTIIYHLIATYLMKN
jgi:hypothetical protein